MTRPGNGPSNAADDGAHAGLCTFAVWGGLLAILGPFCIALTALTRIPEFVTIPTMCTIRLGLLLAGVRYSIEGRDRVDPRKTYVYVSNHQSTLDPR
ncbi:MAG: hypothetical protein IPF53_05905 [Blastocatellia bacterium]|nr:hypothetical protein [Blastocatellia bacterium]